MTLICRRYVASFRGRLIVQYGIKTGSFSGSLQKCQARLGNWTASAPGQLIRKSGVGAVGATRVWNTTNASLQESTSNAETLTAVLPPSSGNTNLELRWSNGKRVSVGRRLSLTSREGRSTSRRPSPSFPARMTSPCKGLRKATSGFSTVRFDVSVLALIRSDINTCASNQNLAYSALSTILQACCARASFHLTAAGRGRLLGQAVHGLSSLRTSAIPHDLCATQNRLKAHTAAALSRCILRCSVAAWPAASRFSACSESSDAARETPLRATQRVDFERELSS